MANLVTVLDSAADASPLVLAVTGDVISDFHPVGTQLVQDAPGIRAKNRGKFNRGNVENRLELAITHAPAATALAAKQAAAALIVAIKDKLLTATLLDVELGGEVFRLSHAALESYDIHPRGTTVFASYQFSGGDLAELP